MANLKETSGQLLRHVADRVFDRSGSVPLTLCTVYDGRGEEGLNKLANIVMLAASWSQSVKSGSGFPLVIKAIQVRNDRLLRILEALGAEIAPLDEPHALCRYSGTYNKLLALADQTSDEARILLDNDIVIVDDIAELASLASRSVMAAVADRAHASPSILSEVKSQLGLELIKDDWVPWNDKYEAAASNGVALAVPGLYFNSGVACSPSHSKLFKLWQKHSRLICEHFAGRYDNQKQRGVFGSDQLPFSTAIREHGRFDHLPIGYNYRVFNFWYGELSVPEIRMVHQVGVRRFHVALGETEQHSLSSVIRNYYDAFMIDKIRCDALGDTDRRLEVVATMRDRVLKILADAGLDDIRDVQAE